MQSPTIVFTKKDTAELLPLDVKPLGENDVLVEVAYTTISNGTERANVGGDPNVSVNDNNTEAHFPRICGYSAAGIVKEVVFLGVDYKIEIWAKEMFEDGCFSDEEFDQMSKMIAGRA